MDIADWLKGQAAAHAATGDKETADKFDWAVFEIESLRESNTLDTMYRTKTTNFLHELYKFLTPVQIETAYQVVYNNELKQQKDELK